MILRTQRTALVRGGALAAAALASIAAIAQTAQAPISTQQPGRQLAETPPPRTGGAGVAVPAAPRPAFVASDVKIRPAGFRVSGSTVFTAEQLQAQVAEFRNKELDFNGLADVAAKIKRFYVDAGYPLTDVYFPEQSFAAQGGTVEFAVIEARIGKVSVVVAPGARVRPDYIRSLVEWHLAPGQLITQAALDRPVLLLRDMPGSTATANVTPGAAVGQADITVTVSPQGRRTAASVGFDNFGAEDIGQYRFTLNGSVDNLLGYGDTTSVSVQPTDQSGTVLYRLGYRSGIGPGGTKASLSFSHSKYQLGGAFATLNASGDAKILAGALIHPLVRSRANNVFFQLGGDVKRLRDESGGTAPERHVNVGKFGLLGNTAGPGLTLGATTSYSLLYNVGQLSIRDAATLAQDQLATGPGTQGAFRKFNIELQRVEYLSDTVTMLGSFAGQTSSKNLTSAEKLSLTGPTAVRGYVAGSDTVVDQGMVMSVEVRQRLGYSPFGAALNVSAFYDYGVGYLHKTRSATTNSIYVGAENRVSVDSWGIGASLGMEGNFFVNATLAWRLGGPTFTGNSSKSQFWLSAVKAF